MHTILVMLLAPTWVAFAQEDELWGRHKVIRSVPEFPSVDNELISRMPKTYKALELPPTDNEEPVLVEADALLMGIWNIEESQELLSVDLLLHMIWEDRRLANLSDPTKDYTLLKPKLLDSIWQPDIFIDRVRSIDPIALLSKPASLRIYPGGTLKYSLRLTIAVSCQMDFRYYPADTQYCNIDLQNYSYTTKQVVIEWNERKADTVGQVEEENSNFKISIPYTGSYTLNTTSGARSGIRFTISLRRNLSYHLLQTYLPSIIIILVSWLSFILPYECTGERMGFSMSCLFTMTAMFSAVRQSTPTVSYIKALDIWMVACISFVFMTLIQHAIVNRMKHSPKLAKYISNKGRKRRDEHSTIQFMEKNGFGETSFARKSEVKQSDDLKNPSEIVKCTLTVFQKLVKKTDKYLSFSIPLLFVSFNTIYWSWLMIKSREEKAEFYD